MICVYDLLTSPAFNSLASLSLVLMLQLFTERFTYPAEILFKVQTTLHVSIPPDLVKNEYLTTFLRSPANRPK